MKELNSQELIKKLRKDPEPFREMRQALKILGDKWSVLILIHLQDKPARFTEIEEVLGGINPRTLTQKLRALESAKLITRKKFKEFPPRIEYSTTKKALELEPTMLALRDWARKYYQEPK